MDVPLIENRIIATVTNGTHIKYDPDLDWEKVHNRTSNPEAIWTCDKCGAESLIHPNYIKAGIKPCIGHGRCYDTIEIIKQMLDLKGWIFTKIEYLKHALKVFFTCRNGHIMSIQYQSLRQSGACLKCHHSNKTKREVIPKTTIVKYNCGCRRKICVHYNYKICYPDAASEWNYELNKGIIPELIAPGTDDKYWHTCSNEWCLMDYLQIISVRTTQNCRCPYCAGKKTCHWNNLQKNYPELCEEFDEDNTVKAIDILPGYSKKVGWTCKTCGHKWKTMPAHRTGNNSGCPQCNLKGYVQRIGGQEHFVQESIKIHGPKYKYIGQYRGYSTPTEIYCPELDKDGETHGTFLQTPEAHKLGSGCQKCANERSDSVYIKNLQSALDELHYIRDINCFHEHPFPGLVYKNPLHVDRYLNESNLVLERDGQYHFRVSKHRGGNEQLAINQERDLIKDIYCLKNGINLFRIPYTTTVTKEMIEKVVELCKIHKHVYISYKHYLEQIVGYIDISNVYVLIMPNPYSKENNLI